MLVTFTRATQIDCIARQFQQVVILHTDNSTYSVVPEVLCFQSRQEKIEISYINVRLISHCNPQMQLFLEGRMN